MTRKKNRTLPEFPHDYIGEKAEEYNQLEWMERNQKKTTLQCVEYLFDPKLGDCKIRDFSHYFILDLGCGTGFSTEVLIDIGFNVVGIDILMDMLEKAVHKTHYLSESTVIDLLLASITNPPFRPSMFHHIVSISAYNFITYRKTTISEVQQILNSTAMYLNRLLKKNGRLVIEMYPNNDKELNLFVSSFTRNKFDGFFIKNNPQQKAGKTFLLLKKIDEI
ncbi:MAG: methyltransferase domain-containing protein [Candidatus Lokiarchaeota archaeon]|nr:methyltransferase domain-containing protein [Candidatus Lokiarchaeota archaeon]